MFERKHLAISLLVSLCATAAFAQSATGQKEEEKEKQRKALKDKHKAQTELFYTESPALASTFFGEGSYLGVYLEEVTPERVKELGLKEERGAIVMKVVENSPAAKAGLKENDVIISYNNRRIESVSELQRLLKETPAGRNVSLEIIRNGAQQSIAATLSKKGSEFGVYRKNPVMPEPFGKGDLRVTPPEFGNFSLIRPELGSIHGGRLGISVEGLTEQLGEYFGVKEGQGVLVTQVHDSSPGAKAGLKAGDVITAVDGQRIKDLNDLFRSLMGKGSGTVTLTIMRNRSEQTVTVTLEKRAPVVPKPRRGAVAAAPIHEVV